TRSILVDQHEIAAPSHRFYNEHQPVEPAGGVPLFAVELEHALQPRLAYSANVRAAQVLADQEAERSITFDPTYRQPPNAVDARMLEVGGQQHVGAPDWRSEEFDGQAELVDEHDLLHPSIDQHWLELIAHGRECQRVKAHRW